MTLVRRLAPALFSIMVAGSIAARPQAPVAPAAPKLEVGAIQWLCYNLSRTGGCAPGEIGPTTYDPSRFTTTFTADYLLVVAFDLTTSYQIRGEPRWMVSDVYRAQVVPGAPATMAQMRQLLLPMLAQAFHLKYHVEDDPSPVYRLEVGRQGPKFKPEPETTAQTRDEVIMGVRRYNTVGDLVKYLNQMHYMGSPTIPHPVEDGTGLKGNYAITLDYGQGVNPYQAPLLAVVQRELGLKAVLVPGHAHYIVVDSIDHLHGKWTSQ